MADGSTQELITALGGGGVMGAFATKALDWLLARKKVAIEEEATLSKTVEARLKTLIDGYESRIADLTQEVHQLRDEVISLRKALDEARAASGFGA